MTMSEEALGSTELSNDHGADDSSYVNILFADFQGMESAFGVFISKGGLHIQTRIAKQLQNDRSTELFRRRYEARTILQSLRRWPLLT
jgi:hypothetical protein